MPDKIGELEEFETQIEGILTDGTPRDNSFNKKFSVLCQKWLNTAREVRER